MAHHRSKDMMKKSISLAVMLVLLMAILASCSPKTCSTKGKTKVPMGFM
jgi:predicted small secreted protein